MLNMHTALGLIPAQASEGEKGGKKETLNCFLREELANPIAQVSSSSEL
jgi:hypothetical protein